MNAEHEYGPGIADVMALAWMLFMMSTGAVMLIFCSLAIFRMFGVPLPVILGATKHPTLRVDVIIVGMLGILLDSLHGLWLTWYRDMSGNTTWSRKRIGSVACIVLCVALLLPVPGEGGQTLLQVVTVSMGRLFDGSV